MFPDSKNALWAVRRRYVQDGILFSFIISQKAIPDFVLSWDKLIAQTSHNFAAGRNGWVIPNGKMPSGLYADGTFREVFVSEQDMGHPDRTDPNFAASFRSGKKPI